MDSFSNCDGHGDGTCLVADKLEIQKQWDTDPCGASTVCGHQDNSIDFYRAIREHRYRDYAPWMDEVLGFDRVHGKQILEIGVGLGSDSVVSAGI